MRNLKRATIAVVCILCAYSITKAALWYTIGNKPRIISYKSNSDILPVSVAQEVASQYNSEKEYFYKYYIEETCFKYEFPIIEIKIDTVKREIWERTTQRSRN